MRRALPLLCASLLLTACGSGGGGAPQRRSSSHSGSETSATSQANSPSGGRADALLSASAAALRSAHSYRLRGTIVQGGHQLHVSFATSDRFRLKLDYAIGGARIAVVALPLATFVRANRAFWLSHAGSRAGALAGRWLQVPAASAKGLVAGLGPLAPASLARCLVENHGTMSQAGRATVEGRPAILLRDAGDAPGSSPSVLAVAAHGKPYPLRYVSTGTQRAGGPIDVCNDGKASSSHGELRFGSFNAVRTIRRPKNYARLRSGASA